MDSGASEAQVRGQAYSVDSGGFTSATGVMTGSGLTSGSAVVSGLNLVVAFFQQAIAVTVKPEAVNNVAKPIRPMIEKSRT